MLLHKLRKYGKLFSCSNFKTIVLYQLFDQGHLGFRLFILKVTGPRVVGRLKHGYTEG